ncbi:MAG TPA: phosphate ABC transporter permease subunit PstC [Bacteroidales bacterium]|nr:phosphate ABC transporter permease subunit PstC [Bacteroidales bacterium]
MKRGRILKDRTVRYVIPGLAVFVILLLIIIGVSLFIMSLPVMEEKNLLKLLTSSEWRPFKGEFGFLPFIISTLYVSLIAIVIALPFSVLISIYLHSYATRPVKRFFEPVVDLLSGIPPVIYGVWGTLTIVPFISNILAPYFVDYSTGYSILAGGIVLAVMIIPLLISIITELFRSVPNEITDASLALGATKWQTAKKVLIRRSLPGIIASIVLALSRAFGETMAVLMVCGNIPVIPQSLFDSGYPLPALIANNYGEMLSLPGYKSALLFAAFLLFIIVVLFNGISRFVLKQLAKSYQFS